MHEKTRNRPLRLAWLSTHPIQYQAPLLSAISKCEDIDLSVLFFSDFSTRSFNDSGFGRAIQWDTPLLDGYKYEFLPIFGEKTNYIRTFRPIVRGLRSRLTRDNFDAVLVQGWQHYGMVEAAWIAKRAGIKVLMRCEATDHVSSSTGLKGSIRESVVRFMLKRLDYCMAIGTQNRNFYLARDFPKERIGFMPYCVDNNHFLTKSRAADTAAIRNEFDLKPDIPIILYAGKLMQRKFPDLLIEAYNDLPSPRPYLLFVGDGELRQKLEDFKVEHKLENVRFLGFRNQGELPALYSLADVFVLPSVDETWGLAINEAMNASCAIITTDRVGSAFDLVKTGENGFVIPAFDKAALTQALSECVKRDTSKAMGTASRAIIESWGIPENVYGLRQALGLTGAQQEASREI